jgi:hypothetical protein
MPVNANIEERTANHLIFLLRVPIKSRKMNRPTEEENMEWPLGLAYSCEHPTVCTLSKTM